MKTEKYICTVNIVYFLIFQYFAQINLIKFNTSADGEVSWLNGSGWPVAEWPSLSAHRFFSRRGFSVGL